MDLLIFWDSGAPGGLGLPVSRFIGDLFSLPVQICPNPLILNGYVGSRRQTDARSVLDTLAIFRQRQEIPDPILLVCGTDLFTEGTASLFGLARPYSRVAVVSTVRLENTFYGLLENEDDLIDRLVKESAHEIGHLFSLEHCTDPECIMYAPLTLDDLDRKKRRFCPECRNLLDRAVPRAGI
ncbi:MAG: archaemetzincin family Zn-dependent metalloprotease [Methanomicrobiales archaeon]|nr:archaemetzincin family Zn-dependent metalloprotease [Methanomicrobiales archaeon]NYT20570.1 archaemetzincin family Zn-dependent metalloprotease [Methanomicrobiales archaeon]